MTILEERYPDRVPTVFSNHMRLWVHDSEVYLDFFSAQPQKTNYPHEGAGHVPPVELAVRVVVTKQHLSKIVEFTGRVK